ncbi:MAG TPA: hypothetical protein VIJ86_11580 [Acidimicrobiales bacterium]
MTEKHAEIHFDEMNWPSPIGGWPENIENVPYNTSAGPMADSPSSWLEGSNCQRFAYGVMALFDLWCPPLRSSNLWKEEELTIVVNEPKPLDLILFNSSGKSFGAHIGIFMTSGEILHLSQEVGKPAVWSFEEFATRPRYSTIVGIKRIQGK